MRPAMSAIILVAVIFLLVMKPKVAAAPAVVASSSPAKESWGQTPAVLAQKWSAPGQTQAYTDIRTVLKLHDIDDYMSTIVHNDTYYRSVRDACFLRFPHCAEMAAADGGRSCFDAKTEVFMSKQCAPACRVCDWSSRELMCNHHDNEALDALRPGDLHRMFEAMSSDPALEELYGPRVIHSRPGGGGDGEGSGSASASASAGTTHIPDGPWVITFDNFLSKEERDVLIHYGHTIGKGFQQSKVRVGTAGSANRTSSTNWINHEALMDPIIIEIQRKLEKVTGYVFPENNFEPLQVLRYGEGGKYDHHHDYFPPHGDRSHGHRVLTIFLYLNDVESGGGETHFRDLGGAAAAAAATEGMAITPRAGRMLIWPSVLNERPNERDDRTFHGSLPVGEGGIKYGANAWIHIRDYRTPKRKCKF
eukprot:CAMPEP_0178616004 /NCGR_PEP_ID=MMETSP0698-20121128/2980_1 /TAXON_ID=265572 /ORGANISM="Extubocellulus spinifer, Strain CCMP396" /LENGTH=419 /DNA_ID=CAMNT_0020254805 /DNA_START=49 /DNA_END=1308 /DNA_ORIENTATION=+